MSMWARAARVEFIIVSVALLVLLLCSNPPKSGKADVEEIGAPGSAWPAEQVTPATDLSNEGADESLYTPGGTIIDGNEPNEVTLDTTSSSVGMPEQRVARLAAVDARKCSNLNYGDVMYGQVTVRWIWNGTQFVPKKVCVVEEEDGSSSVWSFDQQDNAVLSEITGPPGSSR